MATAIEALLKHPLVVTAASQAGVRTERGNDVRRVAHLGDVLRAVDLKEIRHQLADITHVLDGLRERSPGVDPRDDDLMPAMAQEVKTGKAVLSAAELQYGGHQ